VISRSWYDIKRTGATARDGFWTKLYVRGLSPNEAAEQAARQYDSTHRPAWIKKRR
jgi:hypothetical protein